MHSASLYYVYGGWLVRRCCPCCYSLPAVGRRYEKKRALLLLCGAIILTPILMSLQGVSVNTSAFARYLICSLPLLLILMARGIDWLARHVWIRGGATVVAWCLTTLMVLCWMPNITIPVFRQETMAVC